MIARIPIRLRLTLAFTLAMAVVLAAMSVFVFVRVDRALTGSVDRALRVQAQELGHHLNLEEQLLDPDTSGASSVAQFIGADGRLIVSSRPSLPALVHGAEIARVLSGTSVQHDATLPGLDHRWRLLAFPASIEGQRVIGVVASSLQNRDEARHHLAGELLIVGPLGLLLTGIGGYILAAAALRPVEEMRRRATAITGSTPGERLPVPAARDEISQLATTLNATFDRLDAALEHERRFVADASHELRTPLALMRTELELALRRQRSPEELVAAIRSAAEETERLTELAEDLLLIARSEAGELPERHGHVVVADVVDRVTHLYERNAAEAGRKVTVVCQPGLEAEADPTQLERALGNLVENSLLHGAGEVTIEARGEGDRVRLTVADEGSGMPEPFLAHAFERFSRADDARGRGGTGLGLAIVELIARSHGGSAGAVNRPGGGAEVWFTVPRARPGLRDRA
jgi:two-component system OmpR family sensor kinase